MLRFAMPLVILALATAPAASADVPIVEPGPAQVAPPAESGPVDPAADNAPQPTDPAPAATTPRPVAPTAPKRPTVRQARVATREVFRLFVSALDSRLVVGPCAARREHSRVCRARIVGTAQARYRVVVTLIGETLIVRARTA